ncbi:MAG: restriction endonuclease subunit S, partial [Bacillaceae bacterium]|nr:restriction endonuclease subunit S [Bacillaceae bacterium]
SGTLLVKIWLGGNAGLNQHLFKVTSKDYPKWFYYYWTKFYLDKFIRIAADKATTMGHIKRSHLRESLVAVPPQELIKDFNMLFEPIMNKIINTGIESRNLIQLRDALLTKLMSGEIRIPEAEEAVESCLQKSN